MNTLSLADILSLPSSPYPQVLSALIGLVVLSEAFNFYPGGVIFKLLASLSLFGAGAHTASSRFDLLSWTALLARENRFDVFLILGLALAYVGDVLLVGSSFQQPRPKSPDTHARLKLAKLFHSFTLIAYILAFTSADLLSGDHFRRADFVMTLVFGWLFVDRLGLLQKERQYDSWFEVPPDMQWPVVWYSSVTFFMVATAMATDTGYQRILGAWLSVLSNLCVAFNAFGVESMEQTRRDRDAGIAKRSSWVTASLGWVFYFLSQLLLVGSI